MKRLIAIAVLGALTAPAFAVGMGPLAKEGLADGPAKGFYLTVLNPYDHVETFRLYPVVIGGEQPVPNIKIHPAKFRLAAGRQRRVLVVAGNLEPGETRAFRVCAEKDQQEGMIHARVCSKLTASRIAGH